MCTTAPEQDRDALAREPLTQFVDGSAAMACQAFDYEGDVWITNGHFMMIAGPIDAPETDRTALAGIFVFDAKREELDGLLKNDPAIAAGRLVPEIHPWYSDAQHAKRCKPAR